MSFVGAADTKFAVDHSDNASETGLPPRTRNPNLP